MKRLFRIFARALPAPFREQFGEEVIEQSARDYERARLRGIPAAITCTLITALDLIRSGIAERLNPTVVRPHTIERGEKDMREKLHEWGMDLKHAVRSLRRSPGFTVVTVGTLGLAIGANSGMFSVINTVLVNPLPYANADRLVYIGGTAPGSDLAPEFGVSTEFLVQYRENSKLLESISDYNSFTSTLRVKDRVERVRMSQPDPDMFKTLQAKPLLGRLPTAEDGEDVVLLSNNAWKSWFLSDSAVIGRSYFASGRMRTVVGVMRAGFEFPNEDVLVWINGPVRATGNTTGRFGMSLVARMKPGTTPEALATELTTLSKGLPQRFGGSATYAKIISQHRAVVRPLKEQFVGQISQSLLVLFAAVGMVLLIACANVANLFLVRAEGRHRDLAVRRAIGASRIQLVRSQMSEAVVIAGVASVVATLLALISLPALLRAAPPNIPRLSEVHVDAPSLVFTLVVAFLAALACGLFPAVRASAPDLRRLREGGRGSTRRGNWTRDGLVVGQTALALVLLIGSGLLIRSFQQLRQVDPGYDTRDVFTFQIAPEGAGLRGGNAYARFHTDFTKRIAALPGVQSVGLVENVPLNEGTSSGRFKTEDTAPDAAGPIINYTWSGAEYFKTMKIAVRSGRAFNDDDQFVNHGNVVLSKTAANVLWPGKDAIGKRVRTENGKDWHTVIGVVDDVKQYGFRDEPQPLVYYPMVGPTDSSWAIGSPAYVVKTTRAEAIAPEIRALVREVAPQAPMYRVYTMEGLAADSMVQLSFTMLTLGIAAMLALILGAVGLYGVLSYVVAARTREIGVRMALGAEASQVRRMVVAQGARVVAIGVVIGVVVAGYSAKTLGTLLFGVKAFDPATFGGMSLSLIVVGMLASYVPARRASNVDPIESLRGE